MRSIRFLKAELDTLEFLFSKTVPVEIKDILDGIDNKYSYYTVYRSLESLLRKGFIYKRRKITGEEHRTLVYEYYVAKADFLKLITYLHQNKNLLEKECRDAFIRSVSNNIRRFSR